MDTVINVFHHLFREQFHRANQLLSRVLHGWEFGRFVPWSKRDDGNKQIGHYHADADCVGRPRRHRKHVASGGLSQALPGAGHCQVRRGSQPLGADGPTRPCKPPHLTVSQPRLIIIIIIIIVIITLGADGPTGPCQPPYQTVSQPRLIIIRHQNRCYIVCLKICKIQSNQYLNDDLYFI